jgi:hypothetical protein
LQPQLLLDIEDLCVKEKASKLYSFGVFVGDMHREELWVPWRSFRILILCQILCIVAVVEVTMHIKEEEDLHIKGGLQFLVFSRNLTSQLGMNSD